VCPLRFWALSKVIERHAALTTAGGGFELRSERNRVRTALRELDGVLVGASTKVTARDVRSASRAARKLFRSARRASSWAAWTKTVGGHGPAVLVAMPHQASDETLQPPLPALELGGDLLTSGALVPRHVRRDTDDPGPIVLLIGCNTATNATSLDSFAADFRRNGAPVVIATFGEILADQAAFAVRALLTRIDEASRQAHGTIGEALLRARRDLLAEGVVLGLLLVAHGDADWELAHSNGGGG
jgi:hypothetical protein